MDFLDGNNKFITYCITYEFPYVTDYLIHFDLIS